MKDKNIIEVKFNSEKEKIFIFLKPNTTMDVLSKLLDLFKLHKESKIYLLPTEFVESVKVVKDIKDKKLEKLIKFLKKDMAKGWGMSKKELFGNKEKDDTIPLTGAEVSKREFMKGYTPEQIEGINKEIKKPKVNDKNESLLHKYE